MDHRKAICLGAVEKYLLGELEPRQRAEFEEHFFGCPECATDLRLTAEFLDTARKELARGTIGGTTTPRNLKRSWVELFWTPAVFAPALALLLGVIAYQNLVVLPRFNSEIAQLEQPGIVTGISLIGGNSRGGAGPVPSGSAGQPFLLSLDIPAAPQYSSYVCVLVDSSGTVVSRVPVSADQARDTVSINVPASNRLPGDYLLIVRGLVVVRGVSPNGQLGGEATQATDLARYRFKLTPSIDH